MRSRLRAGSEEEAARVPTWHRSLGFRFGLLVSSSLVAFDLLRRPAFDLLLSTMGLRGMGTTGYAVAGAIVSAVAAVSIAILIGVAVSRWLTRRLEDLYRQATLATEGDELPGPFDESGGDEIARLGSAMNALRNRVDERLKELGLKDLRRREWIAQVSHDLRTPLTAQLACLNRADALLEKVDGTSRQDELRELVAVAKLDADRVHTLADDLLEIARLDAGDRLRLEPVPPGELVRQAARRLEPLAQQNGIEIEIQVGSRLPVLHADGRRLTRAIENLMRNAIQHARSSVTVLAMLSEPNVRFEVRDDGRGLPKQPDFLDFLRRRGSDIRLTELAKRRGDGDSAGLGLVVAQRVAEAHGGVVDAYNLSQGGAAFWLAVPVTLDSSHELDEE